MKVRTFLNILFAVMILSSVEGCNGSGGGSSDASADDSNS